MNDKNQDTNMLFANKINPLEQEFKKVNAIANDNTDMEIDEDSKSISKSNVNKISTYITLIKTAMNFDKGELNEGEMTPKSGSKQTSINMVQERLKKCPSNCISKRKLAKIRNQAKNNAIAAKNKIKAMSEHDKDLVASSNITSPNVPSKVKDNDDVKKSKIKEQKKNQKRRNQK